MNDKSQESGAITIHYMLNRGDWIAYYHYEYALQWHRNRLRSKLRWLIGYTILGALLSCGVGMGVFYFVQYVGLFGLPLAPGSPEPIWAAAVATIVTFFASIVATGIMLTWRLDALARERRHRLAARQVAKGEASGAIQTGKRYQLAVSPTELLVCNSLVVVAAGSTFRQGEEYRVAWEAVYDTEIAGTLLIIRTNSPLIIVPSRAFAMPGDFHSLQAAIDRYRNNRLPAANRATPAEADRPTTIQQAGTIQL